MGIWEISTAWNPRSLSCLRVSNAPSDSNSFLSIMAWTPIFVIPTPSSFGTVIDRHRSQTGEPE
jgi:hypothetical protein